MVLTCLKVREFQCFLGSNVFRDFRVCVSLWFSVLGGLECFVFLVVVLSDSRV